MTTIALRNTYRPTPLGRAIIAVRSLREPSALVFRAAVGTVALALLLYGYLIAVTVSDVMERTRYENLVLEASTRVSALEAEYLSRTASITRERAAIEGYVEARTTAFARAGGGFALAETGR